MVKSAALCTVLSRQESSIGGSSLLGIQFLVTCFILNWFNVCLLFIVDLLFLIIFLSLLIFRRKNEINKDRRQAHSQIFPDERKTCS